MSKNQEWQPGNGTDNYSKAVSNAAAAIIKAGTKSGKAAAEVAVGTAAGGPWGMILSTAWSLRHTLYKVLVCLCLLVVFLVTVITSLPSLVLNGFQSLDGNQLGADRDLLSIYEELDQEISNVVDLGHSQSLDTVERLIADGGYEHDRSLEALTDFAQESEGYDACYILAAYCVSMGQRDTSREDLIEKLTQVSGDMFPVTFVERELVVENLNIPEGLDSQPDLEPEVEVVKYLECTIQSFNQEAVIAAFGMDLDAAYGEFSITYGEAAQNMASALRRTLYGTVNDGQSIPLIDSELVAFADAQECNTVRKQLLTTGLSIVGRVPYFWGGKSGPGWNEEWNTPKLVTASGSTTTGTIRPYGLDCSGFTSWVYSTALGVDIGAGTIGQFPNSGPISASELLPGDLGFRADSQGGYSHVLMFAGYGDEGQRMWLHSSSSKGVVLNSPRYEGELVLRRPRGVDYNVSAPVEQP